jgi:predicted ATPase
VLRCIGNTVSEFKDMITDLWIENFKGIGKRQHIPLRPVTLLFGVNSAGKSTLFHALEYLHSIVLSGEADPLHSTANELVNSIGDFQSILHNSKEGKAESVSFGLRLEVPRDQSWNIEGSIQRLMALTIPDVGFGRLFEPRIPKLPWPFPKCPESIELYVEVRSVSARFVDEVNHSETTTEVPLVTEFELKIDGCSFVTTNTFELDDLNRLATTFVNLLHPVWNDVLSSVAPNDSHLPDSPELDLSKKGEHGTHLVVTRLLENPVWRFHHGNPAESFPENAEYRHLRDFITQLADENEVDLADFPFDVHENDVVTITDDSIGSNQPWHAVSVVAIIFTGAERYDECFGQVIDLVRTLLWRSIIKGQQEAFHDRGRWLTRCESAFSDATLIPSVDSAFLPTHGSPATRANRKVIEGKLSAQANGGERLVAAIVDFSMQCVRTSLNEMIHLGSKRKAVPRNLTILNAPRNATWLDGSAAWTWLLQAASKQLKDSANHVDELSKYLHEELWLGTQYRLCSVMKVDVEIFDSFWSQLGNPRFSPFKVEQLCKDGESNDLQTVQAAFAQLKDFALDKSNAVRELKEKSESSRRRFTQLCLVQDGVELQFQDVGEGITQVIPVLAGLLKIQESAAGILLVEQPELHLHPSMAARLADVVLRYVFRDAKPTQYGDVRLSENFETVGALIKFLDRSEIKFNVILETHSEHMILRILRRIRQTTNNELPKHIPPVNSDDICVLWVDNLGDGTIFKRLEINKFGDFIDRWPRGFFTERSEELF